MTEEGIIFRRNRDWLESLISGGFTNSTAALSLADDKLVSPTARDRIVQISGQTKENIKVAKNLIDATIKQNISPIPFNEMTDCNDNNQYTSANDLYATTDYVTNAAKYSSQSSANSLSESDQATGGGVYSIKLKLHGKEANINVSDKRLGEQLEQFLGKFNFIDFIKSSQKEENCKSLSASCVSESAGQKPKPHIVYDRDFLFSLSSYGLNNPPSIIQDIKMSQNHLFRESL